MNTLIVYNVFDKNELLKSKSFIVNRTIKDATEALSAAEADYKGDGEVQIQGYLEISDEELAKGNITRVVG